jgi:hypothetical protein
LNARVEMIEYLILNTGLKSLFGELSSFVKLPVSPFPALEKCLGLSGEASYMQISEGYANVGFDYKVKSATQDCLFDFNVYTQ